jgi:hypothetical protein
MKLARAFAIAGLVFLGITAPIGAIPLILHPSGAPLQMPLSLLAHSPFSNFLIPGIILLAANGLLSFVVLALVLLKAGRYGWWVVLQGCVLTGWITIQVAMIRSLSWLHFLYWAVALVLMLSGWQLRKDSSNAMDARV